MDIFGAIGAIGDAAEGIVNAIVDTVEDVVDTVVEGAENLVEGATETVCSTIGGIGCNVANIVGGVVLGIIHAGQTLFGDIANILRDYGAIIGNLLRGNWLGLLNALINFVMHYGILLADIVRTILMGPIANDIMRLANRNGLKRFVEDRIQTLFANDPDQLNEIRDSINLDSNWSWGLRVPANHYILYMDSANTDLRRLHIDGIINLHELAGLTHGNFTRGNSIIRQVNLDESESIVRIGRDDLNDYIENEDSEVRIRAYSVENRVVAKKILKAKKKCREIGIELNWNDPVRFTYFGNYTYHELIVDPNAKHTVNQNTGTVNLHPFHFNSSNATSWLLDNGLRTNTWSEEANLVACTVFRFNRAEIQKENEWKVSENFGVTVGLKWLQPPELTSCSTPNDRDDDCCASFSTSKIQTPVGEEEVPVGTCVFHRDTWPEIHSQFVLAHEIGHWLGLCHFGHNGFHNLMFTTEEGQGTSWSAMDLLFIYSRGEDIASFTYQDGENTWRYILDQWAGRCL